MTQIIQFFEKQTDGTFIKFSRDNDGSKTPSGRFRKAFASEQGNISYLDPEDFSTHRLVEIQ